MDFVEGRPVKCGVVSRPVQGGLTWFGHYRIISPSSSSSSTDPTPFSRLNDDPIPLTSSDSYTPINVLAGEVSLLSEFGNTNWLLEMAHRLLDPKKRRGVLWTHRTGTTLEWVGRPFNADLWQELPIGASLEAKIYEYHTSDDAPLSRRILSIAVSSISDEVDDQEDSKTWPLLSFNERHAFSRRVRQRDGQCVVSQAPHTNGMYGLHLLPNINSTELEAITQEYVDVPGLQLGSLRDPRFGISLCVAFGATAKAHCMGFYRDSTCATGEYKVHMFGYLHASTPHASNGTPVKHGTPVMFNRSPMNGRFLESQLDELEVAPLPVSVDQDGWDDPQDGQDYDRNIPHNSLDISTEPTPEEKDLDDLMQQPKGCVTPPEGIFAWHYLRCVLEHFATDQLKHHFSASATSSVVSVARPAMPGELPSLDASVPKP